MASDPSAPADTPTDHRPAPPPGVRGYDLPPGVTPYAGGSGRLAGRVVAVGAAVGLGAACAYTFLVDPNTSSAYPQCPLKFLTGIDCPGCGGLRATHALLHGDLVGAADHNLLALVLLPVMAYLFVRWFLGQFDVTIPAVRVPRAFTWIAPVALLVFTVVRNIDLPVLHFLNSGWS